MVDVVAPARTGTSYVEWGAVFAGALAATAITFVLFTAGASIGLSLLSPYNAHSHGRAAASIAVLWSIGVPILAFLAGGYIAGRMRSAWGDSMSEEVQFRDGIHGLLVWALSVVAGGLLAFAGAATAAQSAAQISAGALTDRGAIVAPAVDTLFAASVAQVAPATPAANAQATPRTAATRAAIPDAEVRAVVARTLTAAAAQGQLSPTQKQTLAQIVADRTGMPQAEAEKRVDQAYSDALNAIEKAREAAVLAGLGTATALLVGLLAAWYAAQRGGHHRDNNIPARVTMTFSPPIRHTQPPKP